MKNKINYNAKRPKIKTVPPEEAWERLYGSGNTINSSSTSDELPDGYEWNEKKTKIIPKET
jgi:hypothetical protein